MRSINSVVTAEEVVRQFSTSRSAKASFDHWRSRNPHVVSYVMGHQTVVPFRLDPTQVGQVCATTVHALGNIQKVDIVPVEEITNWRPDFAMTHVFHYALENRRQAFTFQEFRRFCQHDELARAMLWVPAEAAIQEAVRHGFAPALAHDAVQWRIGCAYYSFLRELYTVCGLRSRGVNLLMHPLADALFRVDGWLGRRIVSLYIGNSAFRDGPDGRKANPRELHRRASPPFRFQDIRLAAPHRFGHVHLPDETALDQAADELLDDEPDANQLTDEDTPEQPVDEPEEDSPGPSS